MKFDVCADLSYLMSAKDNASNILINLHHGSRTRQLQILLVVKFNRPQFPNPKLCGQVQATMYAK